MISISHSVIAVDGRWWASVVTTTDEASIPDRGVIDRYPPYGL